MPKKPVEVYLESDGTWNGTHIYNAVTKVEYDDVVEIRVIIGCEELSQGYMIRDAGADSTEILIKEFFIVKEDGEEDENGGVEFPQGGP